MLQNSVNVRFKKKKAFKLQCFLGIISEEIILFKITMGCLVYY